MAVELCMVETWTLENRASVSIRCWGAECVVHHALSNDTHRLSETAGRILMRLSVEAAQTANELAAALEGRDAKDLDSVLAALADLGLITRA